VTRVLADDDIVWLRAFDPQRAPVADLPGAVARLVALATATPAWVERYAELADGVAARIGDGVAGAVESAAAAVRAAAQAFQVVGVEFPTVVLRRAEWVRESLFIDQVVSDRRPERRTQFRIVGPAPQIWAISGIEGTTMDMAGRGVVIFVPQVSGSLELSPTSY
jgi:hypothetical protein